MFIIIIQGSETRVHTQKKPGGFFGWTHPKKPPKNPPQVKYNSVFCATDNEVFYCFKAFKPMTTEFIFCNYSKIIGADI